MCAGKADDNPNPASNPVELPNRPSAGASVAPHPQSSTERPRSKRTHTSSGEHRPKSHRPQSERKSRAGSSSTRPPKTSEHGGRRSSSHREHHRSRRDFPAIQEYPEDRAIRRGVAELGTFIDQHVVSFYPSGSSGYSGMSEMDDPRTRQPAIRRYVAQKVISSMIIADSESSPSPTKIAHEIADDLQVYSSSNGDRLDNLIGLCELGEKLRIDMEDHPASWSFGSFEEGHGNGFVVLIPALSRDGQQVVPSQRFRID
ncbi:uncharacterized protein PAC_05741 [Phialocephala subalpina]|uniref:Uncharacterized protein n=1 Tax=Phialocephala subalpina TaxID=576137 RepID=A0A1L7WSX0_9HELO|nr:uncharacterized protein PAC_05741 [Phialocephala subalpina]